MVLPFALLLVAGCHEDVNSTMAPPTVVCGVILSHGAAGAGLIDIAHHPRQPVVHSLTVGGALYVRVSGDCGRGSAVGIQPRGSARILRVVRARDGLVAGVVLKPRPNRRGTLVAVRDGSIVGTLRFRVRG
jgi:hypothetical protein